MSTEYRRFDDEVMPPARAHAPIMGGEGAGGALTPDREHRGRAARRAHARDDAEAPAPSRGGGRFHVTLVRG
ncbi:hypothetical protein D7I43_08410 [Micromonospora globbae]|uniref:Uncharacterized protein n=1 Tax=Micromonospora globbae TaxID=1894969 RepID=A0A420F455_9ACTN|nr:hypothetical protein D7I43_08410 [Micromonospora globbae]